MVELSKVTEEGVVDKYVELSRIVQLLEAEKKELATALIKFDEQYTELETLLRDKDRIIGDITIEKRRLEDLLKIKVKQLEEAKSGYAIPVDEPKESILDRLIRRKK